MQQRRLHHPSIHYPPLIRVRVALKTDKVRKPRCSSLTSRILGLFLGDPERQPRQNKTCHPLQDPGSSHGSSPPLVAPSGLLIRCANPPVHLTCKHSRSNINTDHFVYITSSAPCKQKHILYAVSAKYATRLSTSLKGPCQAVAVSVCVLGAPALAWDYTPDSGGGG